MSCLRSDQVLVTIGTPCSMSAVGSTETYQALVSHSPQFIGFAAFDAGLVGFDPATRGDSNPRLSWLVGESAGQPATLEAIERQFGSQLRANLGIRRLSARETDAVATGVDIAATLPHDLEAGGLRRLAGVRQRDLRDSTLRSVQGLFDDDPARAPSLQSQLFVYAGLGALAALPRPLAELLPDPYAFRTASATAFGGLDALARWTPRNDSLSRITDKLAMRLATSLASHGPALIASMLAPAYSLSRALKNPDLLQSLRSNEQEGYMRVPQAPLAVVGACASSTIAFCEIAPQLLFEYPGYRRPQLVLWTAADAALQPDFGVLEAFGPSALVSSRILETLNEQRSARDRRPVAECLAPFDIDACGTVVGNAGSGLVITTLDFALRNFLDITSVVVGWGQSSEAGGKGHFAGVGFGGENAIVQALDMAHRAHGFGIADFGYLLAHATGTRTNSRAELSTVLAGVQGAAQRQKFTGALPRWLVGATKTLGDGHSMGETGLKAVSQAIQFVLGNEAPGIPTLRTVEPEIGSAAESFILQRNPIKGSVDGGAVCVTQGFGGYNGAIALRSANPHSLRRYSYDDGVLEAYLERWPQLRAERERREATWRRSERPALDLAQLHRWEGAED